MLFIHGLHSDQSGYQVRAEAAVKAFGLVCLTFDLSGHGHSSGVLGDLSPQDHLDDVVAAYDALARELSPPRHVGVCGASYGAFLTLLLIAQRPVERLLLRAPALVADGDLKVPLRERRPATPTNAAIALENLARFAGQVLILESGRDEVIPHRFIEAYLAACHGRASHEVIPDATHALTDEAWQRQFIDTILRWFQPLVEGDGLRTAPDRASSGQ